MKKIKEEVRIKRDQERIRQKEMIQVKKTKEEDSIKREEERIREERRTR